MKKKKIKDIYTYSKGVRTQEVPWSSSSPQQHFHNSKRFEIVREKKSNLKTKKLFNFIFNILQLTEIVNYFINYLI